MANFYYKLLDKNNKVLTGLVPAFSKSRAEERLSKDGSVVFFIKRNRANSIFGTKMHFSFKTFSKIDRIHFFRNLSTMISSDISLNQSLRTLEEQAKGKRTKRMIRSLLEDVENGRALSKAIKKFPNYFSDFIVETVNVGEVSGNLSVSLDRISMDLEKDYELSRKVTSAMAYPLVVIFVMLVVVAGLIVYVLPKISELFFELGVELPVTTRALIAIGVFMRNYYIFISVGLVMFIMSLVFAYRYRKVKYVFHFIFLKAPIFGEMVKEFNLARFFRSLESLVKSGVSLVRAVEISKKTLKNEVYRSALSSAHPILIHGGNLADALMHYPFLFPLQAQKIVEVGHKSGKFEEIFMRITMHYERSLNYKTQVLTSLLEPILMVVVGVIVGGIALSIFLPIYQASSVI